MDERTQEKAAMQTQVGTERLLTNEPYKAAISGDWKRMKKCYKDETDRFLFPLTVERDTAFHLAVHSKSEEPLKRFSELIHDEDMLKYLFAQENAYGNTILHEAAANGNFKAAKFLMGYLGEADQLLEHHNKYGETPLFKAAAFGSREIVKLFASRREKLFDDNGKLKDIHRKKKDGNPILHAAIQGENFGTALELLNWDGSLADGEYGGMTSLQLLANMPSAFKSGYNMDAWTRFLYFCLPVSADHNDLDDGVDDHGNRENLTAVDPESGQNKNKNAPRSFRRLNLHKVLKCINLSVRGFFFTGWPTLRKIWEVKRKHKLALELAKKLIEEDGSWERTTVFDISSSLRLTKRHGDQNSNAGQGTNGSTSVPNCWRCAYAESHKGKMARTKAVRKDSETSEVETPLLVATKSGIVEIVDEILRVHPQAVQHCGLIKQNILHVAVMHRQKKIFSRVKKMKVAMSRLVQGIDDNGYSILHCAADMDHYPGGTRHGPAYKLQEELKWFRRVEKIVPSHYAMHHDKYHNMTASELFKEEHQDQLEVAQKWIKETSQSCSAVAVLVATVVFAAAYTVPGGSNKQGLPNFIHKPLFLFFTIMDVVALASSLTSVVMFLSILTSPFELEDFLESLPRKLTIGFSLLFVSVATTMLAFIATILLIIHLEPQRWTTTLIYTAAFFPVGVLAMTQLPVFVAFAATLMDVRRVIRKAVPWNLFGF